eukprot:TRINITY_DN15797_c0_g1_i1.p1 TRINITY_DN15797_c0_g1~~TRINITY_DN15797_c0_g1_i1.p1  ORF type:complete len:353 (-),score=52.16 TRINITY_DN15797_c0_g1_i1:88-1008(-)
MPVDEDSFAVSSLGLQYNSNKSTQPAHTFGTGQRDALKKTFVSKKHEKRQVANTSPGPVYHLPSTVGDAPRFGFGTEQRKGTQAKYPDSSVDLMCATVDSQKVKFNNPARIHFGTESRLHSKNAEIVRVHPTSALGVESPGALEYTPDENKVRPNAPEYSFGKKVEKIPENQPVARLQLPLSGVPRHVGPGSHRKPDGLGAQPQSARPSAPSWSFGTGDRDMKPKEVCKEYMESKSADLSSMGRQVVSGSKTAPRCGFGTSTRDHRARVHLAVVGIDRGPAANMEPVRFHQELPHPMSARIPKTGM